MADVSVSGDRADPGAAAARSTGARRTISSGGPWEATVGYSRAVVVGDACWVSGTTDAGPDGRARHPGDVVRTRMFVTDISRAAEVTTVHGELFRAVRPAATLLEVLRLIDDSLMVEIEVEARLNPRAGRRARATRPG